MNYRMIHTIATVLKKAKLLTLVDYILQIQSLIKNRKINKDFKFNNSNFPVPPAHLAFDAYGNVNWQEYFDSGLKQASIIAGIINKESITHDFRILEWGCGPGRVIRHMKNALQNNVELYGADYNGKAIEWNRDNIEGIQFFVNQLEPPFPFQRDFFDCVYALSVFTHLSEELHIKWIKDIERVLKPGGLIIITTHGDLTTDRLLPHEKQLYDSGRLVVRGGVQEGKKWYLAYQPPQFITHKLLKGFDILHTGRFDASLQDIWVARKTLQAHV